MPEPDPWLLGEIDALAGAAEKSGAKPAIEAVPSESSGTRKPPSEASGSRKPVIGAEPGVMPAKPTRSATAALVGISDDLIANASAEDKPIFTDIVAKAEAKSTSGEPAVFDELGLAKTPAVITGDTQSEIEATSAKQPDFVKAGDPTKKTDEGFPIPPPRRVEAKATEPSRPTETKSPAAATSMSRGRPLSRWTPHLLLGTLGLASVIAIGFRCSGSSTTVAQANTGKAGAGQVDKDRFDPAEASDKTRAGGGAGAAGGGGDAVDGGDAGGEKAAEGERAQGGAAADDEPAAEGGNEAAAGGAAEEPAAEGEAANEGQQDAAAKDDTQAAAEPTKSDSSKRTDSSSSSRTSDDATPASTSSKSSSSKDRKDTLQTGSTAPPPDANLTAEELLELARKAWKEGNARDAYKYANKSRYKKPSVEATELATLAACKLHLEKSAKASFDGLEGDKRRKVRQKCREWGVWVGL